jgi:subtilisin family serine protease
VGPGSDDDTYAPGTSFSVSFVSGVVALVLSVEPNLDRAAVEQTLRSSGR